MPVETHLFLVACPVGHLQILIQEVEAQLVNRRFKEVIFYEAEERRQNQHQFVQLYLLQALPVCGCCF